MGRASALTKAFRWEFTLLVRTLELVVSIFSTEAQSFLLSYLLIFQACQGGCSLFDGGGNEVSLAISACFSSAMLNFICFPSENILLLYYLRWT